VINLRQLAIQDLDVGFDDWGIEAALEDGSIVTIIFTDNSVDDEHGQPTALMKTEDVDAHNIEIYSTVSLKNPNSGDWVTYNVEGRRPNGVGVAKVLLRAQ